MHPIGSTNEWAFLERKCTSNRLKFHSPIQINYKPLMSASQAMYTLRNVFGPKTSSSIEFGIGCLHPASLTKVWASQYFSTAEICISTELVLACPRPKKNSHSNISDAISSPHLNTHPTPRKITLSDPGRAESQRNVKERTSTPPELPGGERPFCDHPIINSAHQYKSSV